MGQALEIVAQPQIHSEVAGKRPMVLNEPAQIQHGEIGMHRAERLPEHVRPSSCEVGEASEIVEAPEAIRDTCIQVNPVGGDAGLEQVMPLGM